MRARVAALVMLVGGCAPSHARPSPETVTVASPPSAASSSLSAPPGPERDAGRDELLDVCLTEPWVPIGRYYGPLPLPPEQEERLRSMMEPGCHDPHPELPPGRFAEEPAPAPVCFYAIAAIYYAYRHWIEAARWYRRAAFESAEGEDIGLFAAVRYLETASVLADRSTPPRRDCHVLVARDADVLACRHCKRADEDGACSELQRDRRDAARSLGDLDAGLPPLLPEGCAR